MGPLAGYRIVEIAGIGPTQLCGMLLADMGARVLRVTRPGDRGLGIPLPARCNLMNRSRPAIAVDLRNPDGVELVLRLCDGADALFEGYRPGVMERLGLGPDACSARNPRLVYGRMTGWGQQGPLAGEAGHDTNYLALTGALASIGEPDRPPPLPLNLVADFGGGALYLAVGLLAALLEAARSGRGQVVDAAMVDGVASMMTMFHGLQAAGLWTERRHGNLLDGGAPFMRCYATRDQRHVAVAALEPRFYANLLSGLGLQDLDPAEQMSVQRWEETGRRFAAVFLTRSRDEWCELFAGRDACVTAVLELGEAPRHPHSLARSAYVEVDGIVQPAPAPRFSRTPATVSAGARAPGEGSAEALAEWGICGEDVAKLRASGALLPG